MGWERRGERGKGKLILRSRVAPLPHCTLHSPKSINMRMSDGQKSWKMHTIIGDEGGKGKGTDVDYTVVIKNLWCY